MKTYEMSDEEKEFLAGYDLTNMTGHLLPRMWLYFQL